jgi:hypothetical protein
MFSFFFEGMPADRSIIFMALLGSELVRKQNLGAHHPAFSRLQLSSLVAISRSLYFWILPLAVVG